MQVDLALARQEQVTAVADRAANRAARLWRSRATTDFDSAWGGLRAELLAFAVAAQTQAAAGASPFVAQVARADGQNADSGGNVQPSAFAGVDNSGRELEGLLFGAVTTAKERVGAGEGAQSAFLSSATYLAVMVKAAIHDTARTAELTAMTSRGYTEYIRVINPGACSRCAVLAGKHSGKVAFKRHPACRCTVSPVQEDDNYEGRFANPSDYFDSLPPAEQERIFTKNGAEAIRAGADPTAVVNARRGASKAYAQGSLNKRAVLQRTPIGRDAEGRVILGYTTGEGTTVRGAFGKQNRAVGLVRNPNARYRSTKRIRLMPTTIIGLTDDVELRKVLLRDAGYLDVPVTRAERSAALGGGYAARRAEVLADARRRADDFYRSHGISLG